MLDESHPIVRFKLDLLEMAMPAESAIVFGDMWVVEGGYTIKCADLGCQRALLVDTFETTGWVETRAGDPRLDFYKGDFSDPFFMASIRERFAISVSFDVWLHQARLLQTIHNVLDKTQEAAIIAQPVLKERAHLNSLVYLPGQPAGSGLFPFAAPSPDAGAYEVRDVNTAHWIWAMTPSLIRSVLVGEGFDIAHEATSDLLPNPNWCMWGCIARRGPNNPAHWSRSQPSPGLTPPNW
ncbi:MAG TPA: hypothetical protein VGG41_01595 [Solirubrobacteraceae bacterium]|jgi:hypothetical protein